MNWNRNLSLVIAALYIILCITFPLGFLDRRFVYFVPVALACIWFPGEIGLFTFSGRITKETPTLFIILGGWLLLLLPGVRAIIMRM